LTRVYRILRKPYSKTAFDGEGAYRFGGRWSSPGVRLAYAAEHLSLAIVEYFVHLDPEDPPRDLVVPRRMFRTVCPEYRCTKAATAGLAPSAGPASAGRDRGRIRT